MKVDRILPQGLAQWPEAEIMDAGDFNYMRSAIASLAGIKLSDEKKQHVEARLRSRVLELGLGGFSEYRSFLQSLPPDHSEWQEFLNSLTTNKTDWFREPSHFDLLVGEFVPRWLASRRKGPLRLWSAACSTGEEPYTLAMVLDRALGRGSGLFEVTASDIDTEVLRRAEKGIYPLSDLQQIPEEYRQSAFIPGTDEIAHLMRVRPEIRNRVGFWQLNLVRGPYPWVGEFDVIFCRNVFIYFSKEVIAATLELLYRAAAPDAVLFIGHAESLQGASKWRYVEPSVYVKGKAL